MKMFIVHSDTTKVFYDEQSLVKYLNGEKSKKVFLSNGKQSPKLDRIKIETVEVEVLEETYGSTYLESYIESSKRQIKVNIILGDDLSQKLEKFKSLFMQFAKDGIQKNKFLSQLEITPVEKKSLSKLLTSHVGYLFSVNESVEWFQAILDLHNFRKIEDFYVREIYYSNGTSRFQNVKVNEEAKKSFKLVKESKTS